MPPAARLVDTSVAVALVVGDHTAHRATAAVLAGLRLGLAGHAAFETYSVLTRLPPPARRTPLVIGRLLATDSPATVFPDEPSSARGRPDRRPAPGHPVRSVTLTTMASWVLRASTTVAESVGDGFSSRCGVHGGT